MTALRTLKTDFLSHFHKRLDQVTASIAASRLSREEKARQVNLAANAVKAELASQASSLSVTDRTNYALVLQYCFSVVSLEYRHKVWPYEYMAFSRRIGELWEAFCSAAWDLPARAGVERIAVPSFHTVRNTLLARLRENVGDHHKKDEIAQDIDTLFEIIGDINMNEDEVFSVDRIPHVIDFKSGFGSNEKGNMLRLQSVGRAYRIWNHETRLMLLVRQEQNNNYLRVLRRAGLWEVYTGDQAYEQISSLTGADMQAIRKNVVEWETDLSNDLYDFLKNQPSDLTSYLAW